MRRIIIALGILVIALVAIWVWAGQNGRRPGGSQQPSPHAIDQNG
jgi:hypothetical protein